MINKIKFGGIATTAAALLVSGGASAGVISAGSNTLNFSWNEQAGTLQGEGSIVGSGFGTGSLVLTITLQNHQPDRLTAFAFGTEPNAIIATVVFNNLSGSGLSFAGVAGGTMASNVPGVEVCAWSGPNCSGGGSGGILGGNQQIFTLTLQTASNGGLWGSEVTIDPLGVRYQTANGSFTFPVNGNGNGNGNGTKVSEPGSVALMTLSLGLLALGMLPFRARRQFAE